MSTRLREQIRQYVDRVRQSSFIKSIFTLSAGVVVSQLVALFTTPIISRIYSPDVLGDFSIIISDASIVGVTVCLGLMSAIMIPAEDEKAKSLCRLLLRAIVLLSTILFAAVLAFSGTWRIFSVDLSYPVACALLYVYVVLNNVSSICYAYVNRKKMYAVLFWNPTLGTATNAVVSIVLGLLKCGLWEYALGNIAAAVVVLVHMLLHANPFRQKKELRTGTATLLREYKEFPLYQLPANLIGTVSGQLPVQLIKRFFGSGVLGSYSMCLSILGLPSKFLAGSINRVYYREAVERYNRGEPIGEFSYKILVTNIRIAILPICLLVVFGEPLFAFAFGSQWRQAGSFAALLGVYQLVLFCSACISGGFVVIRRQKWSLYTSIANTCTNLVAFIGGVYLFADAEKVLALYAGLSSLYSLIVNGVFFAYAGVGWGKYTKFVLLYIVLPTGLALLCKSALTAIMIL